MKKIYLPEINSTQLYLKDLLKKERDEYFVWSLNQTNGIGSRNNSWIGKKGNLFFSFSIHKQNLPNDLKIESSSIYFSYLLKTILVKFEPSLFIKWPNDFYIDNKKVGGTITNIVNNYLVCGIGINIKKIDDNFGYININTNIEQILNDYIILLKEKISWDSVFNQYKKDFEKSKNFFATINNSKTSLKLAILDYDGSILINNKRYFSLR